jgi:hypothetical protein|tara:strand:+ start:14706 stop:15269 length:564 start_codon:yes stop_codon:yes gene_type:complete
MANITEILGTDSVSASRPIINSNFELLNDELASVTALLNPTTLTLSGLASVSTSALIVTSANGNLLQVNSLGAVFNTATTFSQSAKFGGTLIKSGVLGSAAVATTQVSGAITAITYFVDANFSVPEAVDGVEITVINQGSTTRSILTATGASLGATSIALTGLNSTVTMRCFDDKWYVISSHNTTIV